LEDGPFSFVVYAYHKALIFTPKLRRVRTRGVLPADVRWPNGDPVDDPGLVLKLYGVWKDKTYAPPTAHLLAASPVRKGEASLKFTLPARLRGQIITLTVVGAGASWQRTTVTLRNVRVYPGT